MTGIRRAASLRATLLLAACVQLLAACGDSAMGGASPPPVSPPPVAPPPPPPAAPAQVYVAPAAENLTRADVEAVLARAVGEAQARSQPAVIAVVDRVGNVLAVFAMNGAPATVRIRPGPGANTGVQGLDVPRTLAAISKGLTAAYLSSGGNAFSSRTASMIVQQHFPPGPSTVGLESGPLFGVQFSQLPCSDLNTRFGDAPAAFTGPKRAPLGLAADPGGLPLYKNGVLVGGVGVVADGDYGFDANVLDIDTDIDELIALAGTFGMQAPDAIRADRISIDGTTLRFSDSEIGALASAPASALFFPMLDGTAGNLLGVPGYYGGNFVSVLDGQTYGTEASGVRAARASEFSNPDAFVLTNGVGTNRYPIRGGGDAGRVSAPLTEAEVRTLLEQAFGVMSSARAQIRQPLNSRAQVSISVVDTDGRVLGIVRSPDAPLFGVDVSLQKARTAAFLSGRNAASDLSATNHAAGGADSDVRAYVALARTFLSDPAALTGGTAFTDRAGGNLSRPYFPDGEVGRPNGPFSLPITQWSIFATGLQAALVLDNIAEHVGFVAGNPPLPSVTPSPPDTHRRCAFIPDVAATGMNRLQNGTQIFPGSVPIYRGAELVGAIGVSGDGIDQDDMIAFLGVDRTGAALGTIGHAPSAMRADRIVINVGGSDVRLRYVSCPFAPFVDSSEQNVCENR